MAPRQFFVGGNFKMNPSDVTTKKKLLKILNDADLDPSVEVVIAPPSLYLLPVLELLRNDIKVAAQNCYYKASGAYTGEISPAQLRDAEVPYVILGHSERRSLFHETSELVAQKVKAAIEDSLSAILCVGETLEQREKDQTLQVIQEQLQPVLKLLKLEDWSKVVIAYEPVWAIGTGKVATAAQAQEVHKDIRSYLAKEISPEVAEKTRIIYGGSVNAKNAPESGKSEFAPHDNLIYSHGTRWVVQASQPDVDGFLVGGASLKPEFIDIVNSGKVKLQSS